MPQLIAVAAPFAQSVAGGAGRRSASTATRFQAGGHQPERLLHEAPQGDEQELIHVALDHQRLPADHGRHEQGDGERIVRVRTPRQVGMVAVPAERHLPLAAVERHPCGTVEEAALVPRLEAAHDDGHPMAS